MIRMIATTIRSSIREKPAVPFRYFEFFKFFARYHIPHLFWFSVSKSIRSRMKAGKSKEEETRLLLLVLTHLLPWRKATF
jgi:hypothetical protein